MGSRTPEERLRDEHRVEQALLGRLLPRHDKRVHTKVVGVTHHNADGSSRQDVIGKMRQFDVVELVRNPQDEFDSNAIQVIASIAAEPRRKKGEITSRPGELQRVQIGHLDGELAAQLAPAIDAGERWWAIATRVGGPRTLGVSLMLCHLVDQP
jgi:hypothetical protein